MNNDGGALILSQKRIKAVAQEAGGYLSVLDVPAKISLERVDPKDVRGVFLQLWPDDLFQELPSRE